MVSKAFLTRLSEQILYSPEEQIKQILFIEWPGQEFILIQSIIFSALAVLSVLGACWR